VEHETPVLRSRRAVLGAALGGAAAAAASAVAAPAAVLATQDQPALAGQLNTSTAPTSFQNTDAGENSLQGYHTDTGTGVYAESASGTALFARVTEAVPENMSGKTTAIKALTGSTSTAATNTDETGIYGYADTSYAAAGVWGDSPQGVGVVATGDWGAYAFGLSTALVGDATAAGVGVYGFTGDVDIPAPPAGIGVYARAASNAQVALQVQGKVKFSRSGRTSIGSTSTSKIVSMSGVTTSSYIIATLQTSVSGVYVRAVVPASGSFRIYLSKAPGKTVYVGYLVIN
jgi:hypothetical protein